MVSQSGLRWTQGERTLVSRGGERQEARNDTGRTNDDPRPLCFVRALTVPHALDAFNHLLEHAVLPDRVDRQIERHPLLA